MSRTGATTINLAAIVEAQVRLRPDREAVVFGDRRWTYGQLNGLVNQVANGLRARGIGPGDHVALSCPNLPYFPLAYLAILKLGAVVVPLNVLFKPREIAYHLQDSDAVAYLCFEGTAELPMAAMGKAAFDQVEACRDFVMMTVDPAAPGPIEGAMTLGRLMAAQPPTFDTYAAAPDETAVILYTSGTTGQPKGAELTHLNLVSNTQTVFTLFAPFFEFTPTAKNVNLITLPLFHSTGQVAQMTAGLYGGMTLVLLPRFEPAAVLETMRRERVNVWVGVPTMYWTLLQHARANHVDTDAVAQHLRLCASGGAPMPVAVLQDFEATFGVRILEGYGLSETSPVAAFNHADRPTRPGTVGQPLFGVDIRCVDVDGQTVPTGQPGEIAIRGPNVMKGYYKRPEATAEVMRNGWFHTGDIGAFDADGYLSIVDRKKDMIIRGGYNVYPRELEEVLMTHPAVSLCGVIGVPDERLGEEVKAYVVLKPGASATSDELLAWSREQFAAYKSPRHIEIRDSLPVSATGKVLKRELRSGN